MANKNCRYFRQRSRRAKFHLVQLYKESSDDFQFGCSAKEFPVHASDISRLTYKEEYAFLNALANSSYWDNDTISCTHILKSDTSSDEELIRRPCIKREKITPTRHQTKQRRRTKKHKIQKVVVISSGESSCQKFLRRRIVIIRW